MEINLRSRTLEILSMEKDGGGFLFYGYDVENGHYYQFDFNKEDGISRTHDHGDRFPNHEFFAAVIGKFDPYAWMAKEPYHLEKGWGNEEIKKCWEYFKSLWGGKESPWKD